MKDDSESGGAVPVGSVAGVEGEDSIPNSSNIVKNAWLIISQRKTYRSRSQ